MLNIHKKPDEISREPEPASPIILFDRFLQSLGVTSTTGWRWRKDGWIEVINIAGRLYISRAAIARFEEAAAAGKFAKSHPVPRRKAKPEVTDGQ